MPFLDTLVTGSKIAAIADAIREKGGTAARLTLDQMPDAIGAIETGGGANAIAGQLLYRGYSTTPDSYVDVAAEDFGESDGSNTIIRAGAFAVDSSSYRNAQRLRSVEIPDWVTQIDYRAFYYSALKSLSAEGDTILTIGQGVFMYSLIEEFCPTRTVELQSYGSQFSMCTALATVDATIRAKSGTTYVPGNCFSGCSALTSARLASDATAISMSTRCLGSCTSLAELVLDFGVVPTLTSTSLTGVPDGCAIYVRDALVDSYKAASYWSARADHILPLSGYEGS